MLPHLGHVGLLASTGMPTTTQVPVLAGYCLIMVSPALLLVAGRVVAARQVEAASDAPGGLIAAGGG